MPLARSFLPIVLLAAVTLPGVPAAAKPVAPRESQPVDEVTFRRDGQEQTIAGRILIEAADGGVLLETDDGALWPIEGPEVLGRRRTGATFAPVTPDELGERLLAQMPDGFRIYTTPHYVVCYNTSREYAQWTSSLLERLHRAFTGYWRHQGLKVHEPEFPLAVLVFADRRQYDQASRDDLPGGTAGIVGFYSLRTNRISMYDLTGGSAGATGHRGSLKEINDMLSQPAAVPLVATIVHEATHQIAFNCGLQQRYADLPLWLCEGLAVYFEAPDLASSRGWRGIGKVNYPRLETFRENLLNWRDGSLKKLVADDRLFRDPNTAVGAYAAAWALNYYLIKQHPREYADYLEAMSKKRPLVQDDPATRMADFRRYFGDPDALEQDFLKQMDRVK